MEGATDVMMGSVYTPEELGAKVNANGEVEDVGEAARVDAAAVQASPIQSSTTDQDPRQWLDQLADCHTLPDVQALWARVQAAGQLDAMVTDQAGQTTTLRDVLYGQGELLRMQAESGAQQAEAAAPDAAQAEAQATLEQSMGAEPVDGGDDSANVA